MRKPSEPKIFAKTGASDFVGRTTEMARLLAHATGETELNGLVMLTVPGAGASELLRQIYDRLFTGQKNVIPFYFEIRASDGSARNAALRFLREFLLQTVAFRRSAPEILDASPEICEIAELAIPADGYWIDRLVETCHSDSKLNDDRSFMRNCLSAPLRAAANGAPAFVLIDNLHATTQIVGGETFLGDLIDIFSRSSIPFVFAGQRRFLYAKTPFEAIIVEPFSFSEAGKFVESQSTRTGVAINEQTRDLIAVQLGGHAGHMSSLFASANGNDFNSFEQVEQSYTDELFGGRICKYYDAIFERILPDASLKARVLRLLMENLSARNNKIPIAYWKKHSGLATPEFDAMIDGLNCHEIISAGSGSVEIDEANIVLGDYIRSRARLEIDAAPRALAVGDALSDNVKRAPQLMARFYRRLSAIGLPELMLAFDGRQISPALLDYSNFKGEFKGAVDAKILKALREDNAKVSLPRIVYTAYASAFYPELNELCDAERAVVALGFADAGEKNETAWIVAETDAKLEATRDLAEFWCDRLEMVAENCNFSQYKLWLIAPEGFAPDAMHLLHERNAYGSSRKQINLLAELLNAKIQPDPKSEGNDYEIIVPMGKDTEMIAVHTVEEIARRHNFPAKAINQIKTALVEACINAAEHSLSPDGKIHQKFAISADKITITVSNRGVRLADRPAPASTLDDTRRGWGLKLIKGLMDEVNIEQTDDGTRITMVKYLNPAQPA